MKECFTRRMSLLLDVVQAVSTSLELPGGVVKVLTAATEEGARPTEVTLLVENSTPEDVCAAGERRGLVKALAAKMGVQEEALQVVASADVSLRNGAKRTGLQVRLQGSEGTAVDVQQQAAALSRALADTLEIPAASVSVESAAVAAAAPTEIALGLDEGALALFDGSAREETVAVIAAQLGVPPGTLQAVGEAEEGVVTLRLHEPVDSSRFSGAEPGRLLIDGAGGSSEEADHRTGRRWRPPVDQTTSAGAAGRLRAATAATTSAEASPSERTPGRLFIDQAVVGTQEVKASLPLTPPSRILRNGTETAFLFVGANSCSTAVLQDPARACSVVCRLQVGLRTGKQWRAPGKEDVTLANAQKAHGAARTVRGAASTGKGAAGMAKQAVRCRVAPCKLHSPYTVIPYVPFQVTGAQTVLEPCSAPRLANWRPRRRLLCGGRWNRLCGKSPLNTSSRTLQKAARTI